MLKITPNKFLSQNLQIGKLEGTSGNLRGPSGTLEPDKCGDACARGGAMRFAHAQYQQGRRETNNYKGGKDIKKGTFLAILKQAGIDKNEL
jgi:hypothetical protein